MGQLQEPNNQSSYRPQGLGPDGPDGPGRHQYRHNRSTPNNTISDPR